jgi:hypothetical protein
MLAIASMGLASVLRAQVTEVPQTIEPGGVLVRVDAISLGAVQDTDAPNEYKALAVGTTLVSAGVTNSLDFEAGAQLFLRDTFTTNGVSHTQSGLGEVSLRVKWTFFNDPSSGQEAAIIPYVIVPTNASVTGTNYTQGGLIVPWSLTAGPGFKLGAMAEWDELRNEANTRYDTRLYASAYAKWSLGRMLSAYGEASLSTTTAGSVGDTGTLGAGATLSVSSNFEWDFEMSRNIGPGRNQWTEALRFRWRLL